MNTINSKHLISLRPQSTEQKLVPFEQKILEHKQIIEQWFAEKWQKYTIPFYGSVDVRHSGFKIASIDMNLFPGGFNNIPKECHGQAANQVKLWFDKQTFENAIINQNIGLLAESHTRNPFYFQHLQALKNILTLAGFSVTLFRLDAPLTVTPQEFEVLTETLVLEQLTHENLQKKQVHFILNNNDLSAGKPNILQELEDSTTHFVTPLSDLGWFARQKSNHFAHYASLTKELGTLIDLDSWFLTPFDTICDKINYHNREGEECLSGQVDFLLQRIQLKYDEYGIKETPYVVIKADSGTYGMGIMVAQSADEAVGLNRKQRNKMAVIKEGLEVNQVIIQEGITTWDRCDEHIAETVLYMMNDQVIGGFARVNSEKSSIDNLNAAGMYFKPLQTSSIADDLMYAYDVVARIALLSASLEYHEKINANKA
jgi:glutamate--cysteine ligase